MNEQTLIYQGKYVSLHERKIGQELYELVSLRPAVIIFARNEKGEFLFVREFRPHETPSERLKPVTGFVDDGHDWLETAKKELREEVGLVAENFTLFHHMKVSGSINTHKYFVIAESLSADPTPLENPDGDVIKETTFLSIDEAIKKSISSEMALTIDSLGLFLIKERNL